MLPFPPYFFSSFSTPFLIKDEINRREVEEGLRRDKERTILNTKIITIEKANDYLDSENGRMWAREEVRQLFWFLVAI